MTIVEVGALNNEHAEILEGLEEGDQVVLYPSDTVGDGTRLAERAMLLRAIRVAPGSR